MTVFVVLINGEVDKVFLERLEAVKYCTLKQQTWSITKIVEKELIGQKALF